MIAKVHLEQVGGYSGATRCFQLSPPYVDTQSGNSIEYVSVVVQSGRMTHQLPEAQIFAANKANGGALGPSMKKLPGSGTLHFHPEDNEHGWHYALIALGVTELVDKLPEPPKPEPAFPDGLDYDPSVVPTYE